MNPPPKQRILHWANTIRSWNIPWKTGIYPLEMAAFLTACEYAGACTIVESGRGPDAYSTRILGMYSDVTGMPVVSIDKAKPDPYYWYEDMWQHMNLTLLTGDSLQLLPKAVGKKTALLLDGPKMEQANFLSYCASLRFDIVLTAHHNCPPDAPWFQEFKTLFPNCHHYESSVQGPEWEQMKIWEAEHCGNYHVYDREHKIVGRSLEQSSLAIARVHKNWKHVRPSHFWRILTWL